MKYNIGDWVLFGEKSWFCEWFPIEVEIMSNRKLGLFGYYYYTRVNNRDIHGLPNWETKRIRERRIEYKITTSKEKEESTK